MPMGSAEPAEPSDFLDRVRTHGAEAARTLAVFRRGEQQGRA